MTVAETRARAGYLAARVRLEIAAVKADRAFLRWFYKRHHGIPTNGAQANRLANETSYLSAALAGAEGPLWNLDIDPDQFWHATTGGTR